MKHWSSLEKGMLAAFLLAVFAALTGRVLHLLAWHRWTDFLVLLLAAANTDFILTHHWGARAARRWGLKLVVLVAVLLAVAVETQQPFGYFYYTDNAGPALLGVPLAMPLLWYVAITNLLLVVRVFLPWISARQEAALVAGGVVAFDWLLEYYAVTRAYWLWPGAHIPWQNFFAWGAITYLFVRLTAPTLGLRWEREWRPVILLAGWVTVFGAARLF